MHLLLMLVTSFKYGKHITYQCLFVFNCLILYNDCDYLFMSEEGGDDSIMTIPTPDSTFAIEVHRCH